MTGIIIDSFAGGGGASTGIEMALGRSPDIAINHDAQALALHQANHPETLHLNSNVWQIDPDDIVREHGPVALAWFSPDCKHFSKAKGGKPVAKNIRDLAWVVILWMKRAAPEVVCLENVEEFQDWGPLTADNRPDPDRKGLEFRRWVKAAKALGYKVEWRELRACDYGAPTIRKRLFLIARRDGKPIVWPAPTHGDPQGEAVKAGRLKPWRTAADIIDWSLPCPSIFDTAARIRELFGLRAVRPLADSTMARIAKGVVRYILEPERPFIAPQPVPMGRAERFEAVAAFMAQHNTGVVGHPMTAPVSTIVQKGCTQALVAAHLTKFQTGSVGSACDAPVPTITANSYQKRPGGKAPIGIVCANMLALKGRDRRDAPADEPLRTICAGGGHHALVSSFLTSYYGNGGDAAANSPVHTITTKDRHNLVVVRIDGEAFAIADIGMRMLTARERFNAQGFPPGYRIDTGISPDGAPLPLTQDQQGRMCGNSVSPPLARAIVKANAGHLAISEEEVAA